MTAPLTLYIYFPVPLLKGYDHQLCEALQGGSGGRCAEAGWQAPKLQVDPQSHSELLTENSVSLRAPRSELSGKRKAQFKLCICRALGIKTLQELRMLSSVTLDCQVTKTVMNSGSQLSEL